MSTLTAPVAPAAGTRFTNHTTGRIWHVRSVGPSGVIGLTEEYGAANCERRAYVTPEELAADYTATPS